MILADSSIDFNVHFMKNRPKRIFFRPGLVLRLISSFFKRLDVGYLHKIGNKIDGLPHNKHYEVEPNKRLQRKVGSGGTEKGEEK